MTSYPAGRRGWLQSRKQRRRLRERCETHLATLQLPRPFDVDQFSAQVGQRRGRPLMLVPIALPPRAPCGMLAATEDHDFIFYQERTSPFHQALIALHEISHLLFGHLVDAVISDGTSQLLTPHLDPSLVRRMLGRTRYSEENEREAETLASLILSRINEWAPSRPPTPVLPAEITELIQRLETSLVPADPR